MDNEEQVVWLVVRWNEDNTEVMGIYTSQARAIHNCKQPNDCVGPVVLDAPSIDKPVEWKGAWYPLARMKPDEH